ncbi:MAG: septum formation initiator family protein [Clostridium sp.]|nr:septum formation initiator family protein [Clostridium sp.]
MENRLTITKIIMVVIFAVFIFSLVRQGVALKRIKENLSVERQSLNQLKEETEKLKSEVESAQSDYEYIEKLARERLGLIKEGEQVIENLEP